MGSTAAVSIMQNRKFRTHKWISSTDSLDLGPNTARCVVWTSHAASVWRTSSHIRGMNYVPHKVWKSYLLNSYHRYETRWDEDHTLFVYHCFCSVEEITIRSTGRRPQYWTMAEDRSCWWRRPSTSGWHPQRSASTGMKDWKSLVAWTTVMGGREGGAMFTNLWPPMTWSSVVHGYK